MMMMMMMQCTEELEENGTGLTQIQAGTKIGGRNLMVLDLVLVLTFEGLGDRNKLVVVKAAAAVAEGAAAEE